MADSIGLSDVSSPDTGKAKHLKTGGIDRRYNMPKECVEKLMKKGMSSKKANEMCYPKGKKKMAKTQKAGTSSKDQLNKVEDDINIVKNLRTKAKIKKNLSRSGY